VRDLRAATGFGVLKCLSIVRRLPTGVSPEDMRGSFLFESDLGSVDAKMLRLAAKVLAHHYHIGEMRASAIPGRLQQCDVNAILGNDFVAVEAKLWPLLDQYPEQECFGQFPI